MTQAYSAAAIGQRINLGTAPVREIFLRAVELCCASPGFALPGGLHDASPQKRRLAIFGTTWFSIEFAKAARGAGIEPIAVVDDFRPGLECAGAPVISSRAFAALAASNKNIVAVNGGRNDRAVRHFERLARESSVPMLSFEQGLRFYGLGAAVDYRLADWGPEIARRADEYTGLEKHAADEYTRQTLYSVLLFHLTGCMEWVHAISRPYPTLYFRSGLFTVGEHERFVDCGASIGESTGGLLALTGDKVDRVWMIEPDKFNQAPLRKVMAALPDDTQRRVSLHQVAVGAAAGNMPFNHVGGHNGSISIEQHAYGEREPVDIAPIDDLVDEGPTLIKMDIEGAELDALKGATRSIDSSHPAMAISAYHRATDLIDLPRFVLSLRDDYRIGLRHHTEERFDTCLYFLPI